MQLSSGPAIVRGKTIERHFGKELRFGRFEGFIWLPFCWKQAVRLLGILYLILAVLLLPPVAAGLFTSDGTISSGLYRLLFWGGSAGFALLGLITIVFSRRRVAAKVNLLMLALTVTAGGAEVFFRVFMPQFVQTNDEQLFRFHPVFGWEFIPGALAVDHLAGGISGTIKINQLGMRDREYSITRDNGKFRIALLGDSFTSGFEVDQQAVFSELLEDSLLTNVEVLNFGVNGYGPLQEYLVLRDKVTVFHPDLVIMLFYLRNDFDDLSGSVEWVQGFTRPHLELSNDGTLVWPDSLGVPEKKPMPHNNATSSHLLKFIKDRLDVRYSIYAQPQEIRTCRKEQPEDVDRAYRLLEPLLAAADTLVRSRDSRFLLVMAPSIVQIYQEQYWRRLLAYRDLDPDDFDPDLPQKRIEAICKKLGISCFDLTPGLREEASREAQLYYPVDKHWNKEGHMVVARLLADYLRTEFRIR